MCVHASNNKEGVISRFRVQRREEILRTGDIIDTKIRETAAMYWIMLP